MDASGDPVDLAAFRLCTARTRIRDYVARQGDPIFPGWLTSVFPACGVQTDTVRGGDKRFRKTGGGQVRAGYFR